MNTHQVNVRDLEPGHTQFVAPPEVETDARAALVERAVSDWIRKPPEPDRQMHAADRGP